MRIQPEILGAQTTNSVCILAQLKSCFAPGRTRSTGSAPSEAAGRPIPGSSCLRRSYGYRLFSVPQVVRSAGDVSTKEMFTPFRTSPCPIVTGVGSTHE